MSHSFARSNAHYHASDFTWAFSFVKQRRKRIPRVGRHQRTRSLGCTFCCICVGVLKKKSASEPAITL